MADCNLLILELKDHENLEENIDSLISKLRRKGLLHEEVSGSTVSERIEKLAADLNRAASDGYSESFLSDLLEVLETIPAFDDITVKFRTNNTELKKPQQETDVGINGVTASDRHFDVLTVGSLPKQKKTPELFSKVEEERYEPYKGRAGTSGSYPQEESQETVDSLKSKIDALTKEIDKLRLQKDHEVVELQNKLTATERQAERAEQRAEHAERRAEHAERRAEHAERRAERRAERQLEREHQIERSALKNQIQELHERINKLLVELDEAQQSSLLKEDTITKTRQKVANLQVRLNELEMEKEGSSLPAIIPLKPFFKDVEPTTKEPLGTGCFGSVFEVQCKLTGACYAAKKFRDDLVKRKDFDKKFHTEFTLLHQLKHKNIVRYVGFTTLQGCLFPALLMEQLDTNLHDYLESEPDIPLAEKVYILLGVGEGLEYLHEKDVLHRDLTAKNVLLDKSVPENPPIPKIADFGNSHVTNTNPIYELESSTGLPGTELYQPPEARRERHSRKIDIFSFGHLSLFVCTQTFPHDKLLDSTYMSTLRDGTEILLGRSEVEQRKYYFAKLDDEQYRPLRALMYRCLDNKPAKRPSASDLVRGLKKIHAPLSYSDDVDSPKDRNGYDASEYQLQDVDIN